MILAIVLTVILVLLFLAGFLDMEKLNAKERMILEEEKLLDQAYNETLEREKQQELEMLDVEHRNIKIVMHWKNGVRIDNKT
jgi:hypothetical protein